MTGQQTIFVDFTARDLKGRFYTAALSRFSEVPDLGDRFTATDHEEFEDVECEVIAVDHINGRVYHRPVDPADVPGTAPRVVVEERRAVGPLLAEASSGDLLQVG